MIRIERLDMTHRASFETLLREVWQQTWPDTVMRDIIKWRYYERPQGGTTWVAVEDDRCVGVLDSMLRRYAFNGTPIWVRETADWYAVPARRPYGLGLWLMRQATDQPEPILVIGGSPDNMALLPRLRWAALPSAYSYVLPLKLRGLAGNLLRRRGLERRARLVPSFVPAKKPQRIPPPGGRRAHVQPLRTVPSLAIDRYGLVPLIEPAHWQWLTQMPASIAEVIGVVGYLDDVAVGVAIAQIEPAASGLDGKIVHVQCDPLNAGWLLSEITRQLADRRVGFIRCCVSTASKRAALEQIGFTRTKDMACHWWPGDAAIPDSIDVGYLRGDDAIPFQTLRAR